MKFPVRLLIAFFILTYSLSAQADDKETRELLSTIVLTEGTERDAAVEALSEKGEPIIGEVVSAWRIGKVKIYRPTDADAVVVMESEDGVYLGLIDGVAADVSGEFETKRPSRKLRKRLKKILDLLDLNSPDLGARIKAAHKLGMSQKPEYLPILTDRLEKQTDAKVKKAFQEAVYLSRLGNGTKEQRLNAIQELGELKSFAAKDLLEGLKKEFEEKEIEKESLTAVNVALNKIAAHQQFVDNVGTFVRGLSTGSVLLLVSYGLAITFGLMGVINMAHGEFIAVGGYTVYVVQNFFIKHYGVGSSAYEWYFIAALPCAFLIAALAGALLEKGMIRFLYKRPLESLLATWGVSMIFQQVFRLQFGAANVSVSSPQWLAGSYQLADVSLSYNRIFLVCFALFVILATWLLLNKTNWGLHVRATMQNRQMASNLGVPSGRVNMLTFAFGSGLAGLAGAFISQIGNVGPSMGQTYIVDSFMVVVVGGVGNLFGAALSSLGIGMVDQSLQPVLGPVMGKITVLFLIILFLQFKPGGIFPARSRSLDD